MKKDSCSPNKDEMDSFPRKSTYSIGNVTYRLQSHFREDGRHLPEMVKRVLLDNIMKNLRRTCASRCAFTGDTFRQETAQRKLESMKKLIGHCKVKMKK